MNAVNSYLPWQSSVWQVLQRRKNEDRLPHALLFAGIEGIGKHAFAKTFAQSLLCDNPNSEDKACHQCRHCRLAEDGAHPDLIHVTPEEKGKAIKVDQIRALIAFSAQTAQLSGFKIMIIESADSMNINAANALLKTLEEPSSNCLIVLLTHRLMALPATIRSRCQIIPFPIPTKEAACDWLASQNIKADRLPLLLSLAKGAPLKVLDFIEQDELSFRDEILQQWLDFSQGKLELVSLSTAWHKLDLQRLFMHWITWIADMIRSQHTKEEEHIVNHDVIENLALTKNIKALHKFLDKLQESQNYILRGDINLNPQLLIEGLLVDWKRIC